jgi:hypothetical protein
MAELLKAVASWQSLLLVLVVFGFAPGFCLRLIVLAYPRSNPRRKELIAELYVRSRIERPLWVAEQLETALFEGLGGRVSAGIRHRPRRRPLVFGLITITAAVMLGIAFAQTVADPPLDSPALLPPVGGPLGATAKCLDGSYSLSLPSPGTCLNHGGVVTWWAH